MSSHIDGDNSINELEGLLEQVKNNEESVPMDSDHPGSFSAIEVEVDSENVDFNVENDRDLEDDVVENDMADECLEKDSEDIVESVSLKNKKEDNSRYRPLNLPLARIKQIIKMDPDVHLAGADAVFLIAKATVSFYLFIFLLLSLNRLHGLQP